LVLATETGRNAAVERDLLVVCPAGDGDGGGRLLARGSLELAVAAIVGLPEHEDRRIRVWLQNLDHLERRPNLIVALVVGRGCSTRAAPRSSRSCIVGQGHTGVVMACLL